MIKNKKGFSLIELLAVIVILGIILAISTVAVNSIRKKQDFENRRNTISGILTGARRYASDHNTLDNLTNTYNPKIKVQDIVDGGYADMDTNEYSDIYGKNVTVVLCAATSGETISSKVKYTIEDEDEHGNIVTYNDCGCKGQNSGVTAEELCTGTD